MASCWAPVMQRLGVPRSETHWSVIKAPPASSSSSSNFKIQYQLQIAYTFFLFLLHIFMCGQTLPVFSRICFFKVILYCVEILIVIQMYQIFNCCRHDVAHVSLVKLSWFGVFQHSWHSIAKRQSRKERIWACSFIAHKMDKRNPNIHYYVKQWQILNCVFDVWFY